MKQYLPTVTTSVQAYALIHVPSGAGYSGSLNFNLATRIHKSLLQVPPSDISLAFLLDELTVTVDE